MVSSVTFFSFWQLIITIIKNSHDIENNRINWLERKESAMNELAVVKFFPEYYQADKSMVFMKGLF